MAGIGTITEGSEAVTLGKAENNDSRVNCFSGFIFVLSVYVTVVHSFEDLNKWL